MIHIDIKYFGLFICFMNVYDPACDEMFKRQATIRFGRYVLSTKRGFRKLKA